MSFIVNRGRIFNHAIANYTNTFNSPFLLSLFIRRISCWKCGTYNEDELNCSSCEAHQEPSKINYFELMKLNIAYETDVKALVPRYHSLQNLYHPDKQSGANEKNRKKAEALSTIVNKAYCTLSDPIERALYLLKLNGITLDEITSNQNPELLILILQYNDEISKMRSVDDARKIKQDVEKELENLSKLASTYFKKNDFDNAKDIVIQMKYYANILKSLKIKVQERGFDI